MDRQEEFQKIVNIYLLADPSKQYDQQKQVNYEPSDLMQTALRVSTAVKTNEVSLAKMAKLCSRKEFSNDPSIEMGELSDSFHRKVVLMKQDLQKIKQLSDARQNKSHQTQQHYNLMTQTLTTMLSTQVQSFKVYANTHAQHLKQRQQRVQRYGQGLESAGGLREIEQQQQQYAMFSTPAYNSSSSKLKESSESQGLVRRRGTPAFKSPYLTDVNDVSTPSRGADYNKQEQMQQQQMIKRNRAIAESRLSNTQRIETTIAQMGDLFNQLSTLVLQQSETIARIEDDVETGLEETAKANEHMQRFYEISKGNRSMILKIFALLIFFVFLFLYWT